MAGRISSYFAPIEKPFLKKLKEIFYKKIPDTFIIKLTSYGMGGSYDLPNIVRFNIKSTIGPKTILHEIIHLAIEPWIIKYKIRHWEKERIVDLILNSKKFDFLHWNDWQGGYNGVETYIDKLFRDDFFRNPEHFFDSIKAVRKSHTI